MKLHRVSIGYVPIRVPLAILAAVRRPTTNRSTSPGPTSWIIYWLDWIKMKIAIVAPSPVPFTIGGAENLFWGLQKYINDETSHQCELIKLPSREHNFADLVRTYLEFSRLDLSHFDMVISTKYPTWMVRHPNHVCYMLHKLRGLYDTYELLGLPKHFAWEGAELVRVRELMEAARRSAESNGGVEDLLEYLLTLGSRGVTPEVLSFPGPFVREVIHFLDGIALSPARISRYVAISENVRHRPDYFPASANVEVAYPPPKLSGFECGSQDYLFTVSRLDGPKRIALLIDAMRLAKAEIPLCIAGTGPEEQQIKKLAAGDARIKFLGFVNDREVVEWYKNALAVPFVPYDEDYGLITIEAMMSGKPVLTLTDSGGPNEFVENGVTGFSVDPTPEAVAAAIDTLCRDRDAAREMGRMARKRVGGITWEKVVEDLLGKQRIPATNANRRRRPRIMVALTFPVYPPRGGGQSRVFHLYKQLAHYADVELVTSCHPDEPASRRELARGLTEIRIPRSQKHQDAEAEYSQSIDWVPVTDVVMSELYKLTPEFERALAAACERADIVVASHPYLGRVLLELAPGKPLWFEAHNVEFTLKRDILPDTDAGKALLEKVRMDEAYCWNNAALVFACAQNDINELGKLYGSTAARTLEVPNGVAIEEVPFLPLAARRNLRDRLGLGGRKLTMFMGSWHGPNLTAVERVLESAANLPDAAFMIVGSVCQAFADRTVPSNVRLMGSVDDAEKVALLGAVEFCLNPMEGGSGSNLKMLDYFASGTPVVSTEFGARGINAVADTHFVQVGKDGLSGAIQAGYGMSDAALQGMANRARSLVETEYSWTKIAERFARSLGWLEASFPTAKHP
jgi:glycosyltransferase involved in cell wall biosynthesis